jgi:hypothetical protein
MAYFGRISDGSILSYSHNVAGGNYVGLYGGIFRACNNTYFENVADEQALIAPKPHTEVQVDGGGISLYAKEIDLISKVHRDYIRFNIDEK